MGRKWNCVLKPSVCMMTCSRRHDDVRIYHKEAKALRARGYEVTILCPDYEGTDKNGIRFVRVPPSSGRIGRILLAPFRYAKAARASGAAFCHVHDPELLPAGLRLRKHMKVIYDVREDFSYRLLDGDKPKPRLAQFLERYELRAAHRIYAVVAATQALYDRFLPVNKRTVLVCGYPNPAEFPKPGKNAVKREFAVGCLGAIREQLGIFEILEAIQGTKATLILAGEFETPELRERCEAHPGWKNVRYLGYVDREEIHWILSRVKVGLALPHPLPQYQDAPPIKMLEYMAAGVPVVVSNFPEWAALVDSTNCGFCVDPLKPDEIRASFTYILENPDAARDMGRNGRRRVLEQYSWEREREHLFQLYPPPPGAAGL